MKNSSFAIQNNHLAFSLPSALFPHCKHVIIYTRCIASTHLLWRPHSQVKDCNLPAFTEVSLSTSPTLGVTLHWQAAQHNGKGNRIYSANKGHQCSLPLTPGDCTELAAGSLATQGEGQTKTVSVAAEPGDGYTCSSPRLCTTTGLCAVTFFFLLLLFAKCCCCYLKFKLIKDFSWQGPHNPTGEFPIAAPFRLRSLGFCARSCHRLCWWLHAGSGVVTQMLRKVRPCGTHDTEFCFTEAPGICLLLIGGAGPVLVCAASTSPARAAPWQMPLGTAVKQTGTTIIREKWGAGLCLGLM